MAKRSLSGLRQAVLYARVSSKQQEKEGFSIPAQLKQLRDYAQSEGIRVVEEYLDVETAKQAGRSSFGEMVDFLHKNADARIILVEKTDRLYRNLKDWVTLDELDLEIHFVKENVGVWEKAALKITRRLVTIPTVCDQKKPPGGGMTTRRYIISDALCLGVGWGEERVAGLRDQRP